MMRSTHTFVELELSAVAYDEIAAKLRDAGYDHAFMESGAIDMHGLAVVRLVESCPTCAGCGRIANDDDRTPWKYWEALPVKSAAAVIMGLVKPLPCPDCCGSGKTHCGAPK